MKYWYLACSNNNKRQNLEYRNFLQHSCFSTCWWCLCILERNLEMKEIALEDTGSVYALRLRKMTQASQGIMKKFFASFLTLIPHSMATEWAVSHYNNIKTARRTSLKQETINGLMHVSLNGKGTAFYDSRPAVFEFLRLRERRNRQPCNELYKDRDFIKNFFQKENGTL